MLRLTRRLLIALNIANWAASLFVLGVLISLIARLPWIEARLAMRHAGHLELARLTEESFMVIGFATIGCAHIIFVRLVAIIDAAIAGRPFAPVNARRLRDVAWALLGIQLLDLVFGVLAVNLMRASGMFVPWSPGVTGWLAILLLFVLARVFGHGAQMQDDLEGTV